MVIIYQVYYVDTTEKTIKHDSYRLTQKTARARLKHLARLGIVAWAEAIAA